MSLQRTLFVCLSLITLRPSALAEGPHASGRVERHQKDGPRIPEGFEIPEKEVTFADDAKIDSGVKSAFKTWSSSYPH